MDSLADSKDSKDMSYCPTRANKLCFQCVDQYVNEKNWNTIFPRQYYEITGKELNLRAERYNITFAKCIDPAGNFGYIYKYGKNVDTNIFSPYGKCSAGGLYFTLESMMEKYNEFGFIIVEITVDDDARVWIEDGKMKADKINVVSKITYEGNSDSDYCHYCSIL